MPSKTTARTHDGPLSPLLRVPFWMLTLASICLFLFFIPGSSTPFETTRVTLVELLVLGTLIVWLVTHFTRFEFRIPRSFTLFSWVALVPVALLSILFTEAPLHSLFGIGVEPTAAFTIVFAVLLLFLVQSLLHTRARLTLFLSVLLGSSFLVLLYSFIRILGVTVLSNVTWFLALPPSLVGTWNELAVFAGLAALGSALAHDLFSSVRTVVPLRVLTVGSFVLALLVLGFINHSVSWLLVMVVAALSLLLIFFQTRSFQRVPLFTVLLLVCASVFFFGGREDSLVGGVVTRANNIIGVPVAFRVDVRPSLAETGVVTLETLKQYPVFGVGANFFNYAWMMHRPTTVNQTIGWGTDFALAWSYLSTFPVLFGGLGLIVLILIIGGFFVDSAALVWRGFNSDGSPLIIIVSASALYAFLVLALYTPGTIWLLITFLLLGVMIAAGRETGALGTLSFRIDHSPRLKYVSSLILVLSIVGATGVAYVLANKSWARTSFFKGVEAANVQGDLTVAETLLTRALTSDSQDVYARTLAAVEGVRLARITQDTSLSSEQLQAQFLQTMMLSIDVASSSIQMSPRNYQNILALGSVYETAAVYGVSGAKDQALRTYAEAQVLAPNNPLIPYFMARVETTGGNSVGARKYLNEALSLKPDYVDAILLLSQVELVEGNIVTAATVSEQAFLADPNNLNVLLQVGYLKYRSGAYADARLVLERARAISPDFSNAKYFLGLTYAEVGERANAIREFEDIARLNPSNTEVQAILRNLRGGAPALSGVADTQTTATEIDLEGGSEESVEGE